MLRSSGKRSGKSMESVLKKKRKAKVGRICAEAVCALYRRVQDRRARTSVARWSGSRVPRRRLSPSVGRWSSPIAVHLQRHAEAARAANT